MHTAPNEAIGFESVSDRAKENTIEKAAIINGRVVNFLQNSNIAYDAFRLI